MKGKTSVSHLHVSWVIWVSRVFDISWIFDIECILWTVTFIATLRLSKYLLKINIIKTVFEQADEKYWPNSIRPHLNTNSFHPLRVCEIWHCSAGKLKQCVQNTIQHQRTHGFSFNNLDRCAHLHYRTRAHMWGDALALGYFCFINANTSLIKWWTWMGFPDRNEPLLKVSGFENVERKTHLFSVRSI